MRREPDLPHIIIGTRRERLLGRVVMGPECCWIWTGGHITKSGYGSFGGTRGEPSRPAHVASYLEFVGRIPRGLQLDHVCHSRSEMCPGGKCLHRRCVNPDHLEPVTSRVNNLRSRTNIVAINARKTHCVNDHEFTPGNTKLRNGSDGVTHRECRACRRDRSRMYRELARQQAA